MTGKPVPTHALLPCKAACLSPPPLLSLALSVCTPALHCLHDFPLSESWACLCLTRSTPFLAHFHFLHRPTQDRLEAETPAPRVTPHELPNDQDCSYRRVSAEGFGFTEKLNYSSGVEEGRVVVQAQGDAQEATLLCGPDCICQIAPGLGSTEKPVWTSQAHRDTHTTYGNHSVHDHEFLGQPHNTSLCVDQSGLEKS